MLRLFGVDELSFSQHYFLFSVSQNHASGVKSLDFEDCDAYTGWLEALLSMISFIRI